MINSYNPNWKFIIIGMTEMMEGSDLPIVHMVKTEHLEEWIAKGAIEWTEEERGFISEKDLHYRNGAVAATAWFLQLFEKAEGRIHV